MPFHYLFATCSLGVTDGAGGLEGTSWSYEVRRLHCGSITCIKQLPPCLSSNLSNLFLNLSGGYGSYLTA